MVVKQLYKCKHNPNINCETRKDCYRCGWNPEEHTRRKEAIQNGELKENALGLKCLHVNAKEEQETDAD